MSDSTRASHNLHPKQLPSCYATLFGNKLQDFDDPGILKAFVRAACCHTTKTFLLDLGEEEAWCGTDLTDEAWTHLLSDPSTPRPPKAGTRWIQVWGAHQSEKLVRLLHARYGFSPRLAALMTQRYKGCSEDSEVDASHGRNGWGRRPQGAAKLPESRASIADDIERGPQIPKGRDASTLTSESQIVDRDGELLDHLSHHDIADAIWHWSSVDLGRRYICLGYNALHNVGPNMSRSDLPAGDRVWNWLILTDDETVILVSDDSHCQELRSQADASRTRTNLLNIIRQMSKASKMKASSSVSLVPIRALMKEEDNAESAAGLLFFYLFDDWLSTYSLLTMPERRYSTKLNELRSKMMKKADIGHVEDLHRLGRQLSVLRRLYQSYYTTIERVLARHKHVERMTPNSGANAAQVILPNQETASSGINAVSSDRIRTYLSPAATDRFERLNHRIQLYILTEIEESIALKDQLLDMNFNLITIKQAESVERLTRITILLAKVTILVLPVTLMTGYFSVQIPGTNFTVKKYWTAFAVILFVSFLGVLLYGEITNTAELNMVYKPFEKLLFWVVGDKLRLWFRRRSRRDD